MKSDREQTLRPPLITGLSEVAIAVADVAAAARFYTEVVGLVPEKIADSHAFLWAGSPGHQQRIILLSTSLRPIEQRSNSTATTPEESRHPAASLGPADFGRTHFALEVPRAHLATVLERVEAGGVEIWGPVEFEWMRSLAYYFLDPDGHLVEFWSPGPRALAEPPKIAGS